MTMGNSDFQVRNKEFEELLKRIGMFIRTLLPRGWGFTLMIFDVDTDSGSMFYLSSAERESMIEALQEFISKNGGPDWLIWSNEHAGWWKAAHRGYTQNRAEAGRYTFDEAAKIVREANKYLKEGVEPNEAMVMDIEI